MSVVLDRVTRFRDSENHGGLTILEETGSSDGEQTIAICSFKAYNKQKKDRSNLITLDTDKVSIHGQNSESYARFFSKVLEL